MQRENLFEGLGLAAMQVRRVIVDTEQRRHVEAIHPERGAAGGIVADLQRIVDIECPHILEILDGEVVTGEREELVRRLCCHRRRRREPGDTGVQGRPVLGHGGRVVAVEDLALRPLGSSVAGGAIGREDRSPGPHIVGLGLIQRPYRGKDPEGLRVESLAGALGDAVVVDGGIHRR